MPRMGRSGACGPTTTRDAALTDQVALAVVLTAGPGLAGILQPKADLQADLEVRNGSVRDLAADL